MTPISPVAQITDTPSLALLKTGLLFVPLDSALVVAC